MFGAGVAGTIWPRATIRKASLIAALSDGHPDHSLLGAIASRSVGSSRIVVALACFFLMMGVYALDISDVNVLYSKCSSHIDKRRLFAGSRVKRSLG